MADDTQTQVVTTEAPEAQPTAEAQPTETGKGETFDLAYVQQLRKEAASYRTRAKALEDQKVQEEQAKLGDLEKATKQLDMSQKRIQELEATLKSERTKWAVAQAAQRLNLDGELAASLVKESEIEFDETGQPQNPEKQLKALVSRWPQLVKPVAPPPSINADAGRGTAPSAQPDREEIKRRFRIS
jgi:vacuolar-type H+-ATPase subunit I/STV1